MLTGSYPTIQHYYIKYFFQPNPGVPSPYTAGIAGTPPTGFSALNPSVVLFTLKITSLQLMATVFLSHLLLPENQKLSHSCQPPGHSAVSAAALGLFGSFALDGASQAGGSVVETGRSIFIWQRGILGTMGSFCHNAGGPNLVVPGSIFAFVSLSSPGACDSGTLCVENWCGDAMT